MKQAFLIAGPTASGKSALSLKLAAEHDGVIINADSMQVYADLRVLTARPSAEEEASVPHRLYGFLDASEVCSAAFWAEKAMAEMDAAWAEGKTPILVGGTGMYFKVLLSGIAEIPEIPEDIRADVRARCKALGSEHLHGELTVVDPTTAARLAPGDSQRICRALEVYHATGIPLSAWHERTVPGPLAPLDAEGALHKLVIDLPRDVLYDRCNRRFDLMLDMGALDEVEQLRARGLSRDLPLLRALGVPSLVAYMEGQMGFEEAIEDAKMQTRRFAKRQLTWFRNQFGGWERLSAQLSERD